MSPERKLSAVDLRQALRHITKLVFGERNTFDESGRIREVMQEAEIVFEDDEDKAALTEMHEEIERLKNLVYVDELTGLMNRRGINDEMGAFFKEALFAQEHPEMRKGVVIADFSVIFIDADNFKSVNDTYGHDEGDRVLKAIAKVLQDHARGIDAVGRLGGEEFVIGLLGATEDDAYAKADELRKLITQDVDVAQDRKMTVSVGVASLHHSKAQTLAQLIEYADKAMYEAKTKRGKDTVVKYSELA
ncbi:MAG: hypothetical protein RLY47_14 [Candidatus Parcubacteria bacterium]|jgi:diguanylate cyclase